MLVFLWSRLGPASGDAEAKVDISKLLSFEVALQLMLVARVISTLLAIISDCDETFNYWEPVHYLLYGEGFQTWEYSPEYGIRSYGYIASMSWFGHLFRLFINDKVNPFRFHLLYSLNSITTRLACSMLSVC